MWEEYGCPMTKGLWLSEIGLGRFVVRDVFGTCSMPFDANDMKDASNKAFALANTRLLLGVSGLDFSEAYQAVGCDLLDDQYRHSLERRFRAWLVGNSRLGCLDLLEYAIPTAYREMGFGGGSVDGLRVLDKVVLEACSRNEVPYTADALAVFKQCMQIERLGDDLIALMELVLRVYLDLLASLRDSIKEAQFPIEWSKSSEVLSYGEGAREIATAVTMCVISLCTSLDVSSRLVHFVNGCSRGVFKTARGVHFDDLRGIRSAVLPIECLEKIKEKMESAAALSSLIQFRHDLVHTTTALETGRVYCGAGTDEINQLPLYYSHVPWRDCVASGQPQRYMGRDYFTGLGVDMEWQLLEWIKEVVGFHKTVGDCLLAFLVDNAPDDAGIILRSK